MKNHQVVLEVLVKGLRMKIILVVCPLEEEGLREEEEEGG